MEPQLLKALRRSSATIHVRWEALLRIEPVNGPLANPDTLVRLIPDSLARVLESLARSPRAALSLPAVRAQRLPSCNCGNNPFLAYFIAGEQAFLEMAVLLQSELPPHLRRESDLAQEVQAVRRRARAEIDTFCGICKHRGRAPRCRHAAAVG